MCEHSWFILSRIPSCTFVCFIVTETLLPSWLHAALMGLNKPHLAQSGAAEPHLASEMKQADAQAPPLSLSHCVQWKLMNWGLVSPFWVRLPSAPVTGGASRLLRNAQRHLTTYCAAHLFSPDRSSTCVWPVCVRVCVCLSAQLSGKPDLSQGG